MNELKHIFYMTDATNRIKQHGLNLLLLMLFPISWKTM